MSTNFVNSFKPLKQMFLRLLCLSFACLAQPAVAQLPAEPLGKVVTLPPTYPDHWVFVHDIVNFQMLNERVILFDADTRRYVGQINSASLAQFIVSRKRPEIYVAETYYKRGTRGERTDVVTIYDKLTLAPIDEIVLPGAKRIITAPADHLAELIADEKFLLVLNFTPASSVTVIDLEKRAVVNEIELAGCSMIYATGEWGFSSLCSDGRLITNTLNADGRQIRTWRSEPLFKVEEDPLFEKAAVIDGIAFFPSFKGRIQPIDLNEDTPIVHESWSLLEAEDISAGYRPGGWQLIGQHGDDEEIYILMHAGGFDGSHKDAGREVWLFDVNSKRRVRRITLQEPANSLKVTSDGNPLLLVANHKYQIDVYSARTGVFKHQITEMGFSPQVFYDARE
jgi:methylamine dehydrogenase heavy chain